MLGAGPDTDAANLLREHGADRDRILEILTQIRGAQRVTSATPESAYEALEKYGRDLVEPRLGAASSTRSSAATRRSAA